MLSAGTYTDLYVAGVTGILTESSKKLILNVPLLVYRNVQQNIGLSKMTGGIVAGGQYFGGRDDFNYLPYLSVSKLAHAQGILYIECYSSGGWGATSNTPCAGWLTITPILYS